jgi:hypothetical protein
MEQSLRLLTDAYINVQKTRVALEAKKRKRIENLQVQAGFATMEKKVDKFGHNIHLVKITEPIKAEALANTIKETDSGIKTINETIAGLKEREKQIAKESTEIVCDTPLYKWCENVRGLGDVSALMYLGYIDPKTSTAGHILSYAGLIPNKGQKEGQDHKFNRVCKSRFILAAKGVIMAKDPFYTALYHSEKEYYAKNYVAKEGQKGVKGHINNRAIRIVARMLTSHAWEMIRRSHGFDVPKHHNHLPPKPFNEEEAREAIQTYINRDREANKLRWEKIKNEGARVEAMTNREPQELANTPLKVQKRKRQSSMKVKVPSRRR